jgi:ABC-type branched-subunit amino acid transport system substrate-binding protein
VISRTIMRMPGGRGWARVVALLLPGLVLLAACTGDRPDTAGSEASPPTSTAVASTGEAVPGADPASNAPGGDAAAETGDGQGAASPTGGPRAASAKSGRTAGTGDAARGSVDTGSLVPPFPTRDERAGISDDRIKLCTHYNEIAGAAVNADQEDVRLFWKWLNERGGVHGRRVDLVLAGDGDGARVAAAYEECRGSFMLVGGPTQEAVPPMREIVEQDQRPMPYLHFMARSDPSKRYSFSLFPTQEAFGRLAADFILSRYRGLRVGIIRRDTPNWEPGFAAFVERLGAAGVRPVAVVSHPQQTQLYDAHLQTLREKGAQVVWAWNHAFDHIPMVKQSRARQDPFKWVLAFPVAAVTETLGRDAVEPEPLVGVSVFATYRPKMHDPRYAEQAREFEAAHAKFEGRDVDPVRGDVLFQAWLDYRQVAELLNRCGRDCTRTKLVQTLTTEMRHQPPSCPFDFRLGRAAGIGINAVQAHSTNPGQAAWRVTAHCVGSF